MKYKHQIENAYWDLKSLTTTAHSKGNTKMQYLV